MRNSLLALACLLAASSAFAADETDALASPDAVVRAAAVAALESAGEGAVPVLRRGIASGRPLVVLACLDVAAQGGLRGTRAAVRSVAEAEATPALLRRVAIRALGRVGDYRDIRFLAGLLDAWPGAALALAMIGDEDSIPVLRERFGKGAASPELAYALATFGVEQGPATLVAMLDGPEGPAALCYLRRYTGADVGTTREAWETWLRLDRLTRGLGDEDWKKSDEFLEVLLTGAGGADQPGLAADLEAIAVDTGRDRRTRTKAILGLGRLKIRSATPAIVRLLFEDPDGMIRVYAAEALGRLGVMGTAVDLVWYLVNDEEEFRKISAKHRTDAYYTIDSEVVKALYGMGAAGALDKMIAQLGSEYRVRVYHQAVTTLRAVTGQNFGYEPDARRVDRQAAAARWRRWFDEHRGEIARPASPGLSDPEFRRRVSELVDGLGNFHFLEMSRARQKLTLLGELVVPELVAGLTRPELHIRTHCAEVLGWIRARSARDALAKALDDPRIEVRTASASALGLMGPGAAAGRLIEVLGDPSDAGLDVRIEAARALARAPKTEAVPALTAALAREENDSDTFRVEAWFALAAHGDAVHVDRLVHSLASRPEVAFRQVIASRLAALTGRDPGVTTDSIAAWNVWWKASRDRYTPASPYGEGR